MAQHSPVSRRSFMKTTAATGAGLLILPSGVLGGVNAPSNKLNIAIIGCGGRGRANTGSVKGENIVALCDVDEKELAKSAKQFPKAKTYIDWRKCLEQKDIDAVVCSTTDHTHAFVTMWALNRDMHVYCEKPLGNSVHEARTIRDAYLAKKGKLATQMGVQRHAYPNMARVAELIHDGAIGTPQSVSVWCGRKPKGGNYLPAAGPPPSHLHWDLWLGPSPEHPYNPRYVSGDCLRWNQYLDFGSGQLGDMGPHNMDIAWWALDLGLVTSCTCEGSPVSKDTAPTWCRAEWQHPANDWRPEVKVRWYQGDKRPGMPSKVLDPSSMGNGALFKGDKGYLLCDFNSRYLMPTKGDMTHYTPRTPETLLPQSGSHQENWIVGCKTGRPTSTDFKYSGELTEHNLLALVAYRTGADIAWDAGACRATNNPRAEQYVKKTYRPGWVLNG